MTVNTSAIEELKSTGMFSYIGNPELKSMIQRYYRVMDWYFSDWREENIRNKLDNWVNFLVRKHHFVPEDFKNIDDPLTLIREDEELVAYLKDLRTDANWRCNGASNLIDAGTELIGLLPME